MRDRSARATPSCMALGCLSDGAVSLAHAGGDRLLRFGREVADSGPPPANGTTRIPSPGACRCQRAPGQPQSLSASHATTLPQAYSSPRPLQLSAQPKTLPGFSGCICTRPKGRGYFNAALSLVLQAAAAARARLSVRRVPILIHRKAARIGAAGLLSAKRPQPGHCIGAV